VRNKPQRHALTSVLEENDPALLAAALGDIARSRGMTQVAKDSGITRKACTKHFDQAVNHALTEVAGKAPPCHF
jgi:probable addiction module antidote protein